MNRSQLLLLAPVLALLALCTATSGQDANALYCEGKRLFVRGAYEEAVCTLDQIIHFGLREKRIYRCRGFARLLTGCLEMAIADFTEAIRYDANDAGLWYGRGVAHYFLGNLRRTSDDLAHALRLYPDYLGASMLRLESLSESKDHAAWREELLRGAAIAKRCAKRELPEMSFGIGRKIVDFRETGPICLENLLAFQCWILLFRERRNTAGTLDHRGAFGPAESEPSTLYAHSIEAATSGDLNRSLAATSRTIAIAPDNWRAYRLRGALSILDGDFNTAVDDLSKAIALNASDESLLQLRSGVYRELGQHEKCYADLKTIIKMGDQRAERILRHQ